MDHSVDASGSNGRQRDLRDGCYEAITARAEQAVAAVRTARGGMAASSKGSRWRPGAPLETAP